MRTVTITERRRRLCRRHHLAGDADGPEAATGSVVALHATDPASVFLSVLARSCATTLDDVAAALYERRSLVRWLGMRRTLFVVPYDDVPVVHAAASLGVATTLRNRLVGQLERNGSDPALDGETGAWVDSLSDRVEQAVRRLGSATGARLGVEEPMLRTMLLARAPSDRPQRLTTSVLTLLGAQGRIVRGRPTGGWTTRQHEWEHCSRWWPEGLPVPDEAVARRELARRWLGRFGPATVDDLRWWSGWSATATRRALADLPVEEVDLHGRPGVGLRDDEPTEPGEPEPASDAPGAVLLPALDPTAMGWRHRDWYLGVDPRAIFDRAGNIGPTVWWDGEVVGSWATATTGEVRTSCPVDRGRDAARAVDAAAAAWQQRLEGAVVTPAARTPLERALVS